MRSTSTWMLACVTALATGCVLYPSMPWRDLELSDIELRFPVEGTRQTVSIRNPNDYPVGVTVVPSRSWIRFYLPDHPGERGNLPPNGSERLVVFVHHEAARADGGRGELTLATPKGTYKITVNVADAQPPTEQASRDPDTSRAAPHAHHWTADTLVVPTTATAQVTAKSCLSGRPA